MLIIAGVALLLDQLGLLQVSWSSVWRFWPLLLVLIGLDVLLGRTRWGSIAFAVVAVVTVVAVLYYVPVTTPQTQTQEKSWELARDDYQSASISLEPGIGDLTVGALDDSGNLVEATVAYDSRYTQIRWDAGRRGDQARVQLVGKHQDWRPSMGEPRDTWQVNLATDTPLELTVNGGVNRATLDLSKLLLNSLVLDMGVGEAQVQLPTHAGYEATISGGVGALRLEVPEQVAARIRVSGGIGAVNVNPRFERQGDAYVTQDYRAGAESIEVRIDGGIGMITID
jgi:hypothetical protein